MTDLSDFTEDWKEYNLWPGITRNWPVKRIQRYPQYSDDEMIPFFEEISKGYCYKQAADHCLYPREWVMNTLYSDDDTYGYMLDLSIIAGARIREGLQQPPLDRYDRLYNKYSLLKGISSS